MGLQLGLCFVRARLIALAPSADMALPSTHPPYAAVLVHTCHLNTGETEVGESSYQSQPETQCEILSLEKAQVSFAYLCGSISGAPLYPIICTVTSPQGCRRLQHNYVEF